MQAEGEVRGNVEAAVRTEGGQPWIRPFYLFCRQTGLWPKEVTGFSPDERPDIYDQACPERLVTPDYPPTYLMHGTADTDVAFECSARRHLGDRACKFVSDVVGHLSSASIVDG